MKCRILIIICGLCASVVANAEIYTWVDSSGVRHYSDVAQGQNAKKADLSKLQSVQSNGSALRFARHLAAEKKKARQKPKPPKITKPKPHEVFHKGRNGQIPVSVSVPNGGLKNGESLRYTLDGKITSFSPTTQTSLTLSNLKRGTHAIKVAIVKNNKVLAQSQSVKFRARPSLASRSHGNNQVLIPTSAIRKFQHERQSTGVGNNSNRNAKH